MDYQSKNHRILLIDMNPVTKPYTVYPLGLAMLAEEAKRCGFAPECISWEVLNRTMRALERECSHTAVSLVAVSIRNIDNTRGIDTRTYFGTILPYLKVISRNFADRCVIGGTGFSLFPDVILEMSGFNWGVVGRHFEIWRNILDAVNRHIPLSYLKEMFVIRNKSLLAPEESRDLASSQLPPLPTGNWFLHSTRWDRVGFDTQAGCGQRCIYCSYPALSGRKKQYRAAEEVVDYVKRWQERGQNDFDIVDDVFNDSIEHAVSCCSTWIAKSLGFRWTAYVRPNEIGRDFAQLLFASGCTEAVLGVDSLSNKVLAKLQKGFDVQTVESAICHLKQTGISVAVSLIVGSEFDTKKTVEETVKNLNLLLPDKISVQYGLRVLPLTPLAKKLGKNQYDLFMPVFSVLSDMSLKKAREFFEGLIPKLERRPIA